MIEKLGGGGMGIVYQAEPQNVGWVLFQRDAWDFVYEQPLGPVSSASYSPLSSSL